MSALRRLEDVCRPNQPNRLAPGSCSKTSRCGCGTWPWHPGSRFEKHIHRRDYFFVVESGGLIRFADPDNAANYEDVQFTDDEVVWVEVGPQGKVDNRLTNIGTTRHRNYVVEFKQRAGTAD